MGIDLNIVPFEKCKFTDDEICVDDISVVYSQKGDCTESTDDAQDITISTRNNGMARFINIKTGENGWSIDDISSLAKIIEDFKKRADIKDDK
jgi:hypothetical protein